MVSEVSGGVKPQPLGLAVFDLDGTLLRGDTVCEAFARSLGRLDDMRRLEARIAGSSDHEIAAARTEMLGWYSGLSLADLTSLLGPIMLAPQAAEGIRLLRRHGVTVAIASITWEFAVAWFAQHLRVDYYVGTRIHANGSIGHFWPRDKAAWVRELGHALKVPGDRVAAVGDSTGDLEMLRSVKHSVFVGTKLPDEFQPETHLPGATIMTVAQWIVERLRPRPDLSYQRTPDADGRVGQHAAIRVERR